MDDELARCKDLASRAREMAKYALNERTRETLLSIADDYERVISQWEDELETKRGQAD